MAWRCVKCGRIIESISRPNSIGCPANVDSNHYHSWIRFESALDKQNKLLEEQNLLVSAALAAQTKEDDEWHKWLKKNAHGNGYNPAFGEKLDAMDKIGKSAGFSHRFRAVGNRLKNASLWLENNPAFWIFVRDGGKKNLALKGTEDWWEGVTADKWISFTDPPSSNIGDAYSEMKSFYKPSFEEANKRIKGKSIEQILIDCFMESDLRKKLLLLDDKPKADDSFDKIMANNLLTLMPKEYLDIVDEEMLKQDGKVKLKNIALRLKIKWIIRLAISIVIGVSLLTLIIKILVFLLIF